MPWPFPNPNPPLVPPDLHQFVDKRRALERATVLAIQCDGCMASDHKFLWIGIVETVFEKGNNVCAKIKIVKKEHEDWRDTAFKDVVLNVADTSLQQLGPKLFCWYR